MFEPVTGPAKGVPKSLERSTRHSLECWSSSSRKTHQPRVSKRGVAAQGVARSLQESPGGLESPRWLSSDMHDTLGTGRHTWLRDCAGLAQPSSERLAYMCLTWSPLLLNTVSLAIMTCQNARITLTALLQRSAPALHENCISGTSTQHLRLS